MAEQLFTISTVAFVLAVFFLLIAIILWFRLGILGIINDLTGRTAKKSIELMRENNTKNGKKVFRMNMVSGRSTQLSEKTAEMVTPQAVDITEKLGQPKAELRSDKGETVLLDKNLDVVGVNSNTSTGETVLLNVIDDTELLVSDDTAVLAEGESETVSEWEQMQFRMIDEVILIHTDEVI